MSISANINEKASLIWAIADKLTGVYKPHEYGGSDFATHGDPSI
ncbi:type I restriction-modification system subunit M N-terminal domain-containing protein [Acetobacterium bakii]|nr:type I restriction-modification system subunit M N-terminal domain-containing protein [Acetobacterium bakii]